MTYGEYEDDIVKRLDIPGVEVKTLPDVAALNTEQATLTPVIYVILHGAVFGERKNLSAVAQQETINGQLFFRARERRGELGVFGLYEKACERLLGYRPPDAKESVTLGQFGYVTDSQNNREYFASFSFTKVRVQADEPENAQPIRGIKNTFTFSL